MQQLVELFVKLTEKEQMKIRHAIAFFLAAAVSGTAFGAPDLAALRSSVGMSMADVRTHFGPPESDTPTASSRNGPGGTWFYTAEGQTPAGPPYCRLDFDAARVVRSVQCI